MTTNPTATLLEALANHPVERGFIIRALQVAADWTEGDLDCGACSEGTCTDDLHEHHMDEVNQWRDLLGQLESANTDEDTPPHTSPRLLVAAGDTLEVGTADGLHWQATVTGITPTAAPMGCTIAVDALTYVEDTSDACRRYHTALSELDDTYWQARASLGEMCPHNKRPTARMVERIAEISSTIGDMLDLDD